RGRLPERLQHHAADPPRAVPRRRAAGRRPRRDQPDRKSTRLNSSHSQISYAVFCLKKKKKKKNKLKDNEKQKLIIQKKQIVTKNKYPTAHSYNHVEYISHRIYISGLEHRDQSVCHR